MPEAPYYRSVADADAYFSSQLWASDWIDANVSERTIALTMATRAIDSLRYRGVKTSVWNAMVADGGDITLTGEQMLAQTELTTKELAAADSQQTKQFPREDADDVESWTLTIAATGGTFTLTLNDETTGAIAYDADSTTIQTALEALTSITIGDVAVEGTGPFTVTMGGTYLSLFNNTLTADGENLTGGDSTVSAVIATDNIPDAIFWAVCEEARSLLAGRDAEQEFRNLELNSDGVGSNRVTMDRSGVHPQHSAHLITSPLAWKYVKRYLNSPSSFNINRV